MKLQKFNEFSLNESVDSKKELRIIHKGFMDIGKQMESISKRYVEMCEELGMDPKDAWYEANKKYKVGATKGSFQRDRHLSDLFGDIGHVDEFVKIYKKVLSNTIKDYETEQHNKRLDRMGDDALLAMDDDIHDEPLNI
jgi:hypothetical protein